MGIVMFLVVGALAGWLAGKLMRGGGFGLPRNLGLGVAGALVGGFLAQAVGISAHGLLGNLVTATAGAALLLWLAAKVRPGR